MSLTYRREGDPPLSLSPVNYPAIKRGASERAFTGIAKSQSRMPLLTHVYVYTYGHSYIHIYTVYKKRVHSAAAAAAQKPKHKHTHTHTDANIYIYICRSALARYLSLSLVHGGTRIYISGSYTVPGECARRQSNDRKESMALRNAFSLSLSPAARAQLRESRGYIAQLRPYAL